MFDFKREVVAAGDFGLLPSDDVGDGDIDVDEHPKRLTFLTCSLPNNLPFEAIRSRRSNLRRLHRSHFHNSRLFYCPPILGLPFPSFCIATMLCVVATYAVLDS